MNQRLYATQNKLNAAVLPLSAQLSYLIRGEATGIPPKLILFGTAGYLPVLTQAAYAVGLFFLYLRQSGSVGVSSDGASIVLQARAVLHGNLLLHNWRVADVSFYTTELPQYALIEWVLGLGAWVVHVVPSLDVGPVITTCAPAPASRRAASLPVPLFAPVTTTSLPA